jgi:hypothetical protein
MLQKQSLPINFQAGMDTKTDTKQLDLGKMYQITNGVYTSPKKISKRNGYTALTKYDTSDNALSDLQSLAIYGNELVSFNDTTLYSYSENIQKWVNKGAMSNLNVTSIPVMRNAYTTTKVQSACVGSIGAFSWKDSRGGCRLAVVDLDTNTFFQSDVQLSASAEDPKIVVNENQFYFFFRETGVIKYKKVNSANPTVLEAAVTVKSNLNSTDPIYDIKQVNNRIYLAYNSTETNELQVLYIDNSDNLSSVASANVIPSECINITNDAQDRIWITYHNGTAVYATCLSYNLNATLLAATLVETIADIVNISAIQTASTTMTLLYTKYNATSSKTLIRKNTITLAGTAGTAADFLRSVGQASKLFEYADIQYTLVVHDSTLQQTYFLVDINGVVQARFSPGNGGTVVAQNCISDVYNVATSQWLLPSQIKSLIFQAEDRSTTTFSTFGINRNIINFIPTINYQDSTLGKNLYVTGGILKNYDGASVTEDNFFLFPEGLTAGANSASGGSMSNGTYQYVAIYSWFDNRGQLHRSATSIPLSVTTAAGGTSQTQEVVIPTLRLTQKSNVMIELYRTEAAGTIFYALTSFSSPTFNSKTVDSVTYTDGASDSSLLDNEQLYTTGGVLDNDPAPNASLIVNWKNRLILAGLEDSEELSYSKEYVPGTPAQFSDFFKINISNQGGPITALGVLDDKLIIFKKSLLFVLSGNGPNATGEQNDYGTPDLVSSDVGCSDPSSVVIMPEGLMFKSSKGIFLLNRGLNVQYIGAEVEAYNGFQINAATLIPNKNQVRFLTNDKYCLVYDTFFQKWSVFDNHGGKDGEVLSGSYVYLREDEDLVFEESSDFLDNGNPISLQIDTGWLSFAGVQGFQRVYKMLGLGEFFSPHRLKIETAFNYLNLYTESKNINSDDFINSEAYGDGSPYGSDAYYGGDSGLNAYQFRLDMKTQKAQSIRIKIKELQNDTYGKGLSLSNLNFEIGLKSGTGKINQSQGFGTN